MYASQIWGHRRAERWTTTSGYTLSPNPDRGLCDRDEARLCAPECHRHGRALPSRSAQPDGETDWATEDGSMRGAVQAGVNVEDHQGPGVVAQKGPQGELLEGLLYRCVFKERWELAG